MIDAKRFLETVGRDLRTLERKIRNHRYLTTVEKGHYTRDDLKVFVGEQSHIIPGDLRSVELLVSRCETARSRDFFQAVLQGEGTALEALDGLARAVGMSDAERDSYEPTPSAQAYSYYLSWLCGYRSEAEVVAAFSVNFTAWGANCGRMAATLGRRFGFGEDDIRFFTHFALAPSEPGLDALAIIEAGFERGVPEVRVARACRLLQAYELMFWDSLYAALKKTRR